MLQVCRICLLFITTDDTYLQIENDTDFLSPDTIRYKITSIFPEMNLNVSKPSVICKSCHNTLEVAFNFKSKCLTTEGIILRFMKDRGMQDDKIDLKHVALLNNDTVFGAKISLENVHLIEVSSQYPTDNNKAEKAGDAAEVIKQECIEISDDEPNDCNSELQKAENFNNVYETVHDSTNYYPKIEKLPVDWDANYAQNTLEESQRNSQSFNQYSISQNDQIQGNQCSICLRTFQSKSLLRKHKTYHCNTRYNSVESNENNDDSNDEDYCVHKQTKTSVKKRFPCKLCSKKFRTSTGLSFHIKRYCKKKANTNKRVYCTDCKKSVVNMMTKGNPYRCHICVQELFDNYNAYKWHMKYVHGADPYHCKLCTKTFTSKKDLCNHGCVGYKGKECVSCREMFLAEYYGYRYKCRICDERVPTYDSYKWHIEVMHKLDKYCRLCFTVTQDFGHVCGFECAACGNFFRSRKDLEMHPHMCLQE